MYSNSACLQEIRRIKEAEPDGVDGDQTPKRANGFGKGKDVPFSSFFSVVLRNFFHQEASSRFDGGEMDESAWLEGGAPR